MQSKNGGGHGDRDIGQYGDGEGDCRRGIKPSKRYPTFISRHTQEVGEMK